MRLLYPFDDNSNSVGSSIYNNLNAREKYAVNCLQSSSYQSMRQQCDDIVKMFDDTFFTKNENRVNEGIIGYTSRITTENNSIVRRDCSISMALTNRILAHEFTDRLILITIELIVKQC